MILLKVIGMMIRVDSSNSATQVNAELQQIPGPTCYFKLVGDNIDKNVKPRYMRSDNQTKSLHYFHVYTVADRVNAKQMSNQMSMIDPNMVDLGKSFTYWWMASEVAVELGACCV